MQADSVSTPIIFWFRNDLRLRDNPAWVQACATGQPIVALVFEPAMAATEQRWGAEQPGAVRLQWWHANARALQQELSQQGVVLWILRGAAPKFISSLARRVGASAVYCSDIAAPYEQAELLALRGAGLEVHACWGCMLFDAPSLPFAVEALPAVFSQFRNAVERARVPVPLPLPAPSAARGFAVAPGDLPFFAECLATPPAGESGLDPRSAFLWQEGVAASVTAGSAGAHRYLNAYFASERVAQYKATRNGLTGMDYSSKWSPWLAVGAVSAREIVLALRAYEDRHGQNEGSYWLWFELLWREYFRWLHQQYGGALYRGRGLGEVSPPVKPEKHQRAFAHWTQGHTGCELVDAGMRELAFSGYSSNRMRQILASFWIYDLGGDWRAGAAWFESQLLDYDVYSNHGNWLYIAGLGTDPRGGRRFNVPKQTAEHDPDGVYRALWSAAA
jgi:deoxyribodipyrimidine photo-lyase